MLLHVMCVLYYLISCELTHSCWDSVEGQPESIVHDIENMVRSFIEKVIFLL